MDSASSAENLSFFTWNESDHRSMSDHRIASLVTANYSFGHNRIDLPDKNPLLLSANTKRPKNLKKKGSTNKVKAKPSNVQKRTLRGRIRYSFGQHPPNLPESKLQDNDITDIITPVQRVGSRSTAPFAAQGKLGQYEPDIMPCHKKTYLLRMKEKQENEDKKVKYMEKVRAKSGVQARGNPNPGAEKTITEKEKQLTMLGNSVLVAEVRPSEQTQAVIIPTKDPSQLSDDQKASEKKPEQTMKNTAKNPTNGQQIVKLKAIKAPRSPRSKFNKSSIAKKISKIGLDLYKKGTTKRPLNTKQVTEKPPDKVSDGPSVAETKRENIIVSEQVHSQVITSSVPVNVPLPVSTVNVPRPDLNLSSDSDTFISKVCLNDIDISFFNNYIRLDPKCHGGDSSAKVDGEDLGNTRTKITLTDYDTVKVGDSMLLRGHIVYSPSGALIIRTNDPLQKKGNDGCIKQVDNSESKFQSPHIVTRHIRTGTVEMKVPPTARPQESNVGPSQSRNNSGKKMTNRSTLNSRDSDKQSQILQPLKTQGKVPVNPMIKPGIKASQTKNTTTITIPKMCEEKKRMTAASKQTENVQPTEAPRVEKVPFPPVRPSCPQSKVLSPQTANKLNFTRNNTVMSKPATLEVLDQNVKTVLQASGQPLTPVISKVTKPNNTSRQFTNAVETKGQKQRETENVLTGKCEGKPKVHVSHLPMPIKGGRPKPVIPSATATVTTATVTTPTVAGVQKEHVTKDGGTPTKVQAEKKADHVSPKQKADQVSPKQKADHVSPKQKADQVSPKQKADHVSPKQKADHVSPKQKADQVSPKQKTDHVSPKQKADQVSPKQKADHVSPKQKADQVSPKQKADQVSPKQKADHVSPKQKADHVSAKQKADHLSPKEKADHVSPKQKADNVSPKQKADDVSPKQKADNVSPKQVVKDGKPRTSAKAQAAAGQPGVKESVPKTNDMKTVNKDSSGYISQADSEKQIMDKCKQTSSEKVKTRGKTADKVIGSKHTGTSRGRGNEKREVKSPWRVTGPHVPLPRYKYDNPKSKKSDKKTSLSEVVSAPSNMVKTKSADVQTTRKRQDQEKQNHGTASLHNAAENQEESGTVSDTVCMLHETGTTNPLSEPNIVTEGLDPADENPLPSYVPFIEETVMTPMVVYIDNDVIDQLHEDLNNARDMTQVETIDDLCERVQEQLDDLRYEISLRKESLMGGELM